ncbi:hypothetical protein TIFTF001_020518 [Ficus carica]|uniref:Uncharacterized protein n=1 Tax=Ficus carica TaxID=3494 RepID=A0AA88DJM0_FICCA|nr:hypothetical protein TIFTF001_020518 [Ficus carica]
MCAHTFSETWGLENSRKDMLVDALAILESEKQELTHTEFSSSGAKPTNKQTECSEVSFTKCELVHSSRESAKLTKKKSLKGEMVAIITFLEKKPIDGEASEVGKPSKESTPDAKLSQQRMNKKRSLGKMASLEDSSEEESLHRTFKKVARDPITLKSPNFPKVLTQFEDSQCYSEDSLEQIDGLMASSEVTNLIEADSSDGTGHNTTKISLDDNSPPKHNKRDVVVVVVVICPGEVNFEK